MQRLEQARLPSVAGLRGGLGGPAYYFTERTRTSADHKVHKALKLAQGG